MILHKVSTIGYFVSAALRILSSQTPSPCAWSPRRADCTVHCPLSCVPSSPPSSFIPLCPGELGGGTRSPYRHNTLSLGGVFTAVLFIIRGEVDTLGAGTHQHAPRPAARASSGRTHLSWRPAAILDWRRY